VALYTTPYIFTSNGPETFQVSDLALSERDTARMVDGPPCCCLLTVRWKFPELRMDFVDIRWGAPGYSKSWSIASSLRTRSYHWSASSSSSSSSGISRAS